MKTLYLVSLGCNKNLVDSEIMLGCLKNYTIINNPSEAKVIIVNTCGFIQSAKQESINTILNLHEQRQKNSLLIVTGCLSERYKDDLIKALPEVDLFSGTGDYDKIDELILKKQNLFSEKTYLQNDEERLITNSSYHAYIKISEGCNQSCSFCAIPKFKGKLFSRSLSSIVKEVSNLVKRGYHDFSFISQDSSSYLRDIGIKDGLINLISEIEKINGVKSARILYLYPSTTSFKLIEKIANSNIFHNYFDIPIQHIDDKMLTIMKRGFGEKKLKEQLNYIRNLKDSFIRTSFIIAHPKENDESFDRLCKFLDEFNFDRINIFEYSDEEDTPAHDMSEKVSKKIAKQRINKIKPLVQKSIQKSLQNEVGKEIKIVIDKKDEFFFIAKALKWAYEIDGEILINDSKIKNLEVGKIYTAKITKLAGNDLIGEIIHE